MAIVDAIYVDNGEYRYKCPICGKVFNRRAKEGMLVTVIKLVERHQKEHFNAGNRVR